MVWSRRLAQTVRENRGLSCRAGRTLPRQLARQSPPLRGRRKRGEEVQAIGRSRGGRTSKIHALADHRGRPIAFALTPGNVADISMAQAIVAAVDPPKRLIADKAYDAEHFRNWLAERRIKAVIPSTASRRTPYPIDCNAYRRRNVIERLFCKLKNWRRIATRYDRLAQNYIAALALAAVVVAWIK
ncbi:MAG TPA: IS5 family transposase [Blastocatellia bacterium]|nr:IS5 family transposase [Blastocatellia bacterium]